MKGGVMNMHLYQSQHTTFCVNFSESRAFSCWRSKLVVSLWSTFCSVLERVVWIYHPLKPMTGFHLNRPKLVQRHLKHLKAENAVWESLDNGWSLRWTCLSCCGTRGLARDRRGSQGMCPATAVSNRVSLNNSDEHLTFCLQISYSLLAV